MREIDTRIKEILLKQMELLQEECKEGGSGYERPRDLAAISSAMADLANAYSKVCLHGSLDDFLNRLQQLL